MVLVEVMVKNEVQSEIAIAISDSENYKEFQISLSVPKQPATLLNPA
jgi:hypothetical protein